MCLVGRETLLYLSIYNCSNTGLVTKTTVAAFIKEDYNIKEIIEYKPAAVMNSVVPAVELTPTQDRPSDVRNCRISADKSRALSSVP